MKYVKTLLFISTFFILNVSEAQVLQSKIAKLGYSSSFMPFQEDDHYSFHFDLESSTRSNFVTSEIGAGFMRNGSDLYYLKFDYKFYPISAILNNFRYQGLYLSLGPGIYYEDLTKNENRYGLGLFTTAGLQFLLNNRISLAFEVEMNFVSNLGQNDYASREGNNSSYFSNSIKIGYVFNKKSKSP
ncbi:MAG: hypothetical protein KAI99_12825 [Cyclobacteriaceae bacterium]|nr:hypothetical protein [Cyclobacteriaceae bacterium]